ncbi:helix-turn-helix domain-containing protein [Legionella spiritensis]|uniref:Putative DNA-binding transcriptional regulator n=1 Tax=Legionella spiritensis TaxID=452 RepID=A0A0W0YY34_LEGSP|nr:helix-turn-helix domain-containing protein [Legionella spiritensis]KTD61430.1 putative DNA-binding transcriptional regulator [Legionella spiritensis]SNV33976.1 DNA-binding transcriptional regulator [Legionella spiritensis]
MLIIRSPTELAILIKNQRKKLGLSQAEVGDLVNLKQKTISAIENSPESVKLGTLFRILSAIDLEINIAPKNESDETTSRWNDEW